MNNQESAATRVITPDNCKKYAKDIKDLYDDFIKICNNAGVNKNE